MIHIPLIHLSSLLNGQDQALLKEETAFLGAINASNEFAFVSPIQGSQAVFYVQTGGSEPVFLSCYEDYPEPYLFLVTGERNSLAASLEMLSFLQAKGKKGKIIMGKPEDIAASLRREFGFLEAKKRLVGTRYGVIGKPSDWLIASPISAREAKQRLGVEVVDVDYQEFLDAIDEIKEVPAPLLKRFEGKTNREKDLYESLRIYLALKGICQRHNLAGFTLRCFDLLNLRHQTSCLAFGLLGEEGIIAGCEGDVPAMLTMALVKALYGYVPFMANPSHFDLETGVAIFAHCTIPFSFVTSYSLSTHFESGLGFGIRGKVKEGPITAIKLSSDYSDIMCLEGNVKSNPEIPTMCRSQIEVDLGDGLRQILDRPHGNHMVFLFGYKGQEITDFLTYLRD